MQEKFIADKSNHYSFDGLSIYKHQSRDTNKAGGNAIADPTYSFQEVKLEYQYLIDHQPQLPGFSQMTDCDLSFTINYGQKMINIML